MTVKEKLTRAYLYITCPRAHYLLKQMDKLYNEINEAKRQHRKSSHLSKRLRFLRVMYEFARMKAKI